MTKQEAVEIKKALHGEWKVYFQSNTGKLRVIAYSYTDNRYVKEDEQKKVSELLNKVAASGHRPAYEIDHKTYQGFIHDTYVVFS